MKIDGNELAILQNDLDRRGQKQEAWKVKQGQDFPGGNVSP